MENKIIKNAAHATLKVKKDAGIEITTELIREAVILFHRIYSPNDNPNINWEIMNQFRLLHIQEAGRETRSEETWRRQLEMVKKSEAFVVCAYRKNQLINLLLRFLERCLMKKCYYAM